MRGRLSGSNLRKGVKGGIRPRAFINMHAQSENAGDALVLRELVHLVSSRVPTDLYLGDWPESFVDQLDLRDNGSVTTHARRNAVGLVADVLSARFSGWQCYYFLTAGAPHGERTIKQFVLDLVRICWLAVLAILGVRICQVGVSFEDIGPRHARVLRWRSRLLYASVPRDQTSYKYMKKLGIRATGTMPDVTLNLFMSPPTEYGEARDRIAFSFRVDKYPNIDSLLLNLVSDICARMPLTAEFVFVAQVSRDIGFMRELSDAISVLWPQRVKYIDCHRNIDDAFAIYRTCGAVLSNRLHALLPGLKEGATPVALLVPNLDPKILGVFESIGLQDQVMDIYGASADEVVRHMAPISFDGGAVAKDLNHFFDRLFVLSN